MIIKKYIREGLSLFLLIICSFSFWNCSTSDNDVEVDFFLNSNQYGNTMAVFGGSVSNNASVCREYWAEKLNLKITNFAVPNYGFAKPGYLIRDIVDDVIENNPPFDIYLFWCSTNDLRYRIGEVDDYSSADGFDINNLNTQAGGINYCFYKILKTYPNAKIMLFTSLRSFSEIGYQTEAEDTSKKYLFQFVDIQIACCKKWGIPYLDQFYETPFNISNYTGYYKDDVHPNMSGYNLIKERQALFIASAYY
jgi:hypothetical protein